MQQIADWLEKLGMSEYEAFGRVVDRLRTIRVLLIVTFRPEFEPPWIGRPYVTVLTINRLGEREAGDIVDRLVGNKQLAPSIRADIIERTDGIPLFVEEMTKAVLEADPDRALMPALLSGTSGPTPSIPATLHASLMARLDRLGAVATDVAQKGAAFGREFGYDLVAAIADIPEPLLRDELCRLTNSGLLFARGTLPQASYT